MTKWQWILRQLTTRLWLRVSVFCIIGVGSALLGLVAKYFIPADFSRGVGASAVNDILNIIATSMLAVTTFSLSVMVAAHSAAASTTTPRATQLLLADNTAQNALSTFIGAFLFSIVGLVTLKANIYGDSGRLVLFVVTILVLLFVVLTLLNWISYLANLGRVNETVDMVERAASQAISHQCRQPCLGGTPLHNFEPQAQHQTVIHPEIGYIRYIDIAALSHIAEEIDQPIYLGARTGFFNDSCRPLAYFEAGDSAEPEQLEKLHERIRSAFRIGGERCFEQDPRYGLIVLTEIATRALNTHDAGTAIDVIGTLVRVMAPLAKNGEDAEAPAYPNVHVPPIKPLDIFEDTFIPIARDGSGIMEVSIRLQKALASLAALGDEAFCQKAAWLSQYSLQQSLNKLDLDDDKEKISQLASICQNACTVKFRNCG